MEQSVRKEYQWLAEETRYLAATFGFDMSAQAWQDHDRLMDGCECLDRHFDSSPDSTRTELGQAIIRALREEEFENYPFHNELQTMLRELSMIFNRYSEPEYFICRAERIFQLTEEIRLTVDRQTYIGGVCEEGRCFLEMFLPIFEIHATPLFLEWFPSVAEVGNLVDNLVDSRADFQRGELLIYPGVLHHLTLLKEIAVRGRTSFLLFPNQIKLFIWAIRFFNPKRHMSAYLEGRAEKS